MDIWQNNECDQKDDTTKKPLKLPWISICLPMIPCKGAAMDALTRGSALTKEKNCCIDVSATYKL